MSTSLVPIKLAPEESQYALTECLNYPASHGHGFGAVDPLQA
jgi:hypothetical protein